MPAACCIKQGDPADRSQPRFDGGGIVVLPLKYYGHAMTSSPFEMRRAFDGRLLQRKYGFR